MKQKRTTRRESPRGASRSYAATKFDPNFGTARQADETQARKRSWGQLHGLPVVVKDVFATPRRADDLRRCWRSTSRRRMPQPSRGSRPQA
jgi:hypothetical protein